MRLIILLNYYRNNGLTCQPFRAYNVQILWYVPNRSLAVVEYCNKKYLF